MTRQEAMRQTAQEDALLSLGFTQEEAKTLRRISMTLHRWHEGQCGTDIGRDSFCIVRGTMDAGGDFQYSDDGVPYMEISGCSGRNRYHRVRHMERGAKRRLAAIMERVNRNGAPLGVYVQTDARGAALYILRPGDILPSESVESCYTRGVCVWLGMP